jgi:hypothetical protein
MYTELNSRKAEYCSALGQFYALAWLHRGACENSWRAARDLDDLTIPPYVDRRSGAKMLSKDEARRIAANKLKYRRKLPKLFAQLVCSL